MAGIMAAADAADIGKNETARFSFAASSLFAQNNSQPERIFKRNEEKQIPLLADNFTRPASRFSVEFPFSVMAGYSSHK
jgi:hypothetical protein